MEGLIAIFIWVGLSIACGFAASSRGRNAIGWSLFAAFFSPVLAILFLLAFGAVGKKCPRCAEDIKKEARVCKHCGFDFTSRKVRK